MAPTSRASPPTGPPPPGRSPAATGCPIGELLAMLGQPHMLSVLHAFESRGGRPLRFGELQEMLGIAPKTLSDRLRTLVTAGFLTRRAYAEIPPRVEYEPTAKTGELDGLFELLASWARQHTLTAVPVVSVVGRAR